MTRRIWLQDTFERGFKAFDSFQPGSNFEAWMTTIERNAYFNQYAKSQASARSVTNGSRSADTDANSVALPTATPNIRRTGSSPLKRNIPDAFAPEEIMAALAKLFAGTPAGVHRHRRHRRQVLPAGGR